VSTYFGSQECTPEWGFFLKDFTLYKDYLMRPTYAYWVYIRTEGDNNIVPGVSITCPGDYDAGTMLMPNNVEE